MHEDWYDDYEDGCYDIAIMDEFKASKTLTWMNQFLQGHPMHLKKKGVPGYLKRDNLPVIILSNYSPENCYNNVPPSHLDPLMRRLTLVVLDSQINLFH